VGFARRSGPVFIRFVAYFGILGLLAMGAGELIGTLTQAPTAMALGLRGTIEPSQEVALVPTKETDWTEAAPGLGLKESIAGDEPMEPAPYLLQ
jgi:hypothetical protein